VITGSPSGQYGCAPSFTAYSTSKAGSWGLMRILAIDYVNKNIRVNGQCGVAGDNELAR
jgi:NAD(P)-dependent dehydrogenase (short-subunit alcohol dehydrogenase family)